MCGIVGYSGDKGATPGIRSQGGASMTMSVRLASIAAASLSLVLGLAWGAPVQAASFGGRAVSALVNLPGLGSDPIYIVDTGQLAADGGWAGEIGRAHV